MVSQRFFKSRHVAPYVSLTHAPSQLFLQWVVGCHMSTIAVAEQRPFTVKCRLPCALMLKRPHSENSKPLEHLAGPNLHPIRGCLPGFAWSAKVKVHLKFSSLYSWLFHMLCEGVRLHVLWPLFLSSPQTIGSMTSYRRLYSWQILGPTLLFLPSLRLCRWLCWWLCWGRLRHRFRRLRCFALRGFGDRFRHRWRGWRGWHRRRGHRRPQSVAFMWAAKQKIVSILEWKAGFLQIPTIPFVQLTCNL